jgi:RHS repeat-associated protein
MVDALGQTTSYAYDERGQLIATTDALGQTIVWAYDDLGHRISQSNPTESPLTSIVWTYDGAGRILTRVADGITTSYVYDANGNRLAVDDGTFTITSTYDRLNRVLTVDDEDAGTTPDTTYAYALTSPSWTDPTGAYAATLDRFDRATAVNDPANVTDFSTTYGADGQPLATTDPNGNSTTLVYDRLGRLTSKNTTAAGPVNRALYAWTYNRAGQILSEDSQISGDPANGTVTYAYDPLARLTGSTLSATTTTYGWDKVPNRTSVTAGGPTATTAYDAANRPTSGTNPTAAYTSDPDGRLTARPGQTMAWDRLGRLTAVKDAAGTLTLATYTYDPLDRLRMVDYGTGGRTRFRYVGLTTSAAQLIDDTTGTVTRNIGNGWTGERLLDWTGTNSDIAISGTNAHHDVTWLATSTGAVGQALRYDPWGTPRSAVPQGYTSFRFQGSFYDAATDLSWVVSRWYAPALGRFISEDDVLGEPRDPDSRHLYAYGEADPIARWDPDGQWWRVVEERDTLWGLAERYLGAGARWRDIVLANPAKLTLAPKARVYPGQCIWIPRRSVRFVGSCDVYWRYDLVLAYMTAQMRQNTQVLPWHWRTGSWLYLDYVPAINNDSLLVAFGWRERPGGDWDHKPKLAERYGERHGFYTPIRGDSRLEAIYYDIWSNIHYGYVGRSYGIPNGWLRDAQHVDGGVNSKSDDLSVEIGMNLWSSVGNNLTQWALEKAILSHMPDYRRFNSTDREIRLRHAP